MSPPNRHQSDAGSLGETREKEDITALRERLLSRAKKHLLLADTYLPEIEAFLQRLESNAPILTGLPAYIRSLDTERQSLRQLVAELAKPAIEELALKQLNKTLDGSAIIISHGATHWGVLKRCRNFVTVNQNFIGSSRDHRKKEAAQSGGGSREKHQIHKTLKDQSRVTVHVVDWGREWVDIRPLSQERLARQMTDSGWSWGDYELGDRVDGDEWADMVFAKQVQRLVAAAKMNRHEYQYPRIRLVLPNISRGQPDIDVLLDQLCHFDQSVEVTIEDASSSFLTTPPPPVDVAFTNLVGNELENLTQTLNMDHTILIDLVSDITHFDLDPQPWQASTTQAQINEEKQHGGLMAPTLYPLLKGRTLVCTREAAEHFQEVLSTVGTETERERARLLVPWDDATRAMTPEAIRADFARLSIHPPPSDVQIPIQIITHAWNIHTIESAVSSGSLPGVALDVVRCSGFRGSKLSIYTYGWAEGYVTLTSNKEVRGQIRTWLEANRRDEGELGPRIWRLDVTRNLLAKSVSPPDGNRGRTRTGGNE